MDILFFFILNVFKKEFKNGILKLELFNYYVFLKDCMLRLFIY